MIACTDAAARDWVADTTSSVCISNLDDTHLHLVNASSGKSLSLVHADI